MRQPGSPRPRRAAFTVLELLVVIAIIAVIVSLTVAAVAAVIAAQEKKTTEQAIKKADGRLFLIETSSLPQYALTRKFYVKHDYEQHAVLRDYYADGDDMVVFRKRLAD